jgi:hypothetical protein
MQYLGNGNHTFTEYRVSHHISLKLGCQRLRHRFDGESKNLKKQGCHITVRLSPCCRLPRWLSLFDSYFSNISALCLEKRKRCALFGFISKVISKRRPRTPAFSPFFQEQAFGGCLLTPALSIDAQRSRLSGQMAAKALPQPGHIYN